MDEHIMKPFLQSCFKAQELGRRAATDEAGDGHGRVGKGVRRPSKDRQCSGGRRKASPAGVNGQSSNGTTHSPSWTADTSQTTENTLRI